VVSAAAVAVVVVALSLGYLTGMDQGRITVARAIELLRRQPQDAEVRVIEVLTDKDGKAVDHVDGPATGIEFTRIGPVQHVHFVGEHRRDTDPAPSNDPG
jgi:hypothetical protein